MKPIYVVLAIIAVILTAWLISYSGTVNSVKIFQPANNSFINTPLVNIKIKTPKKSKILIDNIRLEEEPENGVLERDLEFQDGPHEIKVIKNAPLSPFKIERSIQFTVDTKPPSFTLNLRGKKFVTRKQGFPIEGTVSEECDISINGVTVSKSDKFKTSSFLQPGENEFNLKFTDKAGNSISSKIQVFFDDQAPRVTLIEPKKNTVLKDPYPDIKLEVSDINLNIGASYIKLDGYKLKYDYDPETGMISYTCQYKQAEGIHSLEYVIKDKMNNKAIGKSTFMIESTEEFGDNDLVTGAKGKDIKVFQKRLNKAKVKVEVTGVFDEQTKEALAKFQKAKKITGEKDRAGIKTIAALSNSVEVNLEKFRLYLYSPDKKLLKSYLITCGEKKYPTPTGSFYLNKKEKNPTWVPPNSEWAKGKKVTGPGKDNPLGTRWMGFIGNKVGIHGTRYPQTLGTASSHGCIRMSIPASEELYELVNVGSRVIVKKEEKKKEKKDDKKKTDREVSR